MIFTVVKLNAYECIQIKSVYLQHNKSNLFFYPCDLLIAVWAFLKVSSHFAPPFLRKPDSDLSFLQRKFQADFLKYHLSLKLLHSRPLTVKVCNIWRFQEEMAASRVYILDSIFSQKLDSKL